jgi:hypothetical protein
VLYDYLAVGGSTETVSDQSCPASDAGRPALDVDAAGKVYVTWGGRDSLESNSSGPVCYAVRDPGSGNWTRADIGKLAQGDRFALEVAGDGTVYLMRGVRSLLLNYDGKGDGGHDQESLYLERYQAGGWQSLPARPSSPKAPMYTTIMAPHLLPWLVCLRPGSDI